MQTYPIKTASSAPLDSPVGSTFLSVFILVFILMFYAAPAAAQDWSKKTSPFIGVAHSSLKIKLDELPNFTRKIDAVGVNAGIPITDHFWLEAKVLKGIDNKTIDNLRIELDHYVGASLVGRLPIISTGFSLYGSVGAGKVKLTRSIPTEQISASETGVNYGFGLMYSTGPLNFRVGYENLYSDEGADIEGLNVGGSLQF